VNIYGYQKPIGNIKDIPELRNRFIAIYDTKSKKDMARFGLLYGRYLLDITGFAPCEGVVKAFDAVQRWIDGKTDYHEARNISFPDTYRNVCDGTGIIRNRFYRTMGQIKCIPHVKAHALWASDFAITLINRMYPDSADEVIKERKIQMEFARGV
jgi:hypothetical protein